MIPKTKPKYIVCADFDCTPEIPKGVEYISENNGWSFSNNQSSITTKENLLTWCEFSSGLAVNFAILRGYKEIYLAGIDLIEDGKPFNHYDGVVNTVCTDGFRCRREKEFIQKLKNKYNVKLYNLNPKCDWLETIDIGINK